MDFALPELGEGVESGDVLNLLVKEGDVIRPGQAVIELETDKATAEVPSPHGGRVTKLHVREGQTISVGSAILSLEPTEPDAKPAGPPQDTAKPPAPEKPQGEKPESKAPPAAKPKPEPKPDPPAKPPAAQQQRPKPSSPPMPPPRSKNAEAAPEPVAATPPAGPAVRRLARELGVDLSRVRGSGPSGRIVREDVIAAVRNAAEGGATNAPPPVETEIAAGVDLPGEPDADAWGEIRRERMSRIRRTIAEKMHQSWATIPRVTNFDNADITELERQRQSSKEDYAQSGIKLTTLPFVIKAAALCLRRHPVLNASIDMEAGEIFYKAYVHVGVAVDTDRGLVVPVIRDVDRMRIPEIAKALAAVAENARTGRFSIDDLRGGTFSISNLGAVGGTYSTPIINYPEVAILLVGRARKRPVIVDEAVQPRLMMPLSLSYDHRLVDGAAAARFLNDVIAYLEAPARLLLAP
jgi:pyruvate dehydrogenase E2 component (dihydrolipoamide acetyltransferase)